MTHPTLNQNGPTSLRPGPRGFTLVELVVVIGVIALLCGLLFAVTAAARQRARTADCTSHLRQLHHAFQLYATDSDGFLPPYQDRLRRGVPERTGLLVASLAPYTSDARIWFCPVDPFDGTTSTTGDVRHRFTSYRTGLPNSNPRAPALTMDGPYDPAAHSAYWREPHPSQNELLSDCLWIPGSLPRGQHPPYSHSGSFQWLYFDGHVRSVRWGQMSGKG